MVLVSLVPPGPAATAAVDDPPAVVDVAPPVETLPTLPDPPAPVDLLAVAPLGPAAAPPVALPPPAPAVVAVFPSACPGAASDAPVSPPGAPASAGAPLRNPVVNPWRGLVTEHDATTSAPAAQMARTRPRDAALRTAIESSLGRGDNHAERPLVESSTR